jgi:hypothetical protein
MITSEAVIVEEEMHKKEEKMPGGAPPGMGEKY